MRIRHMLAAVFAIVAVAATRADVFHATQGPFGRSSGLWGPVVSQQQSVGARFIPSANRTLMQVRIRFMNDGDVPGAPHLAGILSSTL